MGNRWHAHNQMLPNKQSAPVASRLPQDVYGIAPRRRLIAKQTVKVPAWSSLPQEAFGIVNSFLSERQVSASSNRYATETLHWYFSSRTGQELFDLESYCGIRGKRIHLPIRLVLMQCAKLMVSFAVHIQAHCNTGDMELMLSLSSGDGSRRILVPFSIILDRTEMGLNIGKNQFLKSRRFPWAAEAAHSVAMQSVDSLMLRLAGRFPLPEQQQDLVVTFSSFVDSDFRMGATIRSERRIPYAVLQTLPRNYLKKSNGVVTLHGMHVEPFLAGSTISSPPVQTLVRFPSPELQTPGPKLQRPSSSASSGARFSEGNLGILTRMLEDSEGEDDAPAAKRMRYG